MLIYEKLLGHEGHEVVAKAYDGEQAVSLYTNLSPSPDIIIMDHLMPNKNGLDASKEILSFDPECKIIFISADSSIKPTALNLGVISFLEKPVKLSELLSLIK